VLAEFAASDRLTLIDPLGHRLKLEQLYPWPFDPAYLGRSGVYPDVSTQSDLRAPTGLPQEVTLELERAGREAHAPYSSSPSALVLETPVGFFTGGVLESIAFNPTLEPGQTALVALVANGGDPASISRAWLAQPSQGPVDLAASTAALLAAIAPTAKLSVHQWSV
jgi:cytidine deaminase